MDHKLTGELDTITFWHDGDQWTARVGEKLVGVRREQKYYPPKGSQPERHVDRTIQLPRDSAVVLKIVIDDPYHIYTDGGQQSGSPSAWASHFLVGRGDVISMAKE